MTHSESTPELRILTAGHIGVVVRQCGKVSPGDFRWDLFSSEGVRIKFGFSTAWGYAWEALNKRLLSG